MLSASDTLQRFIIGLAPLPLAATTEPHTVKETTGKQDVEGVAYDLTEVVRQQTVASHELVAFDPNAGALWPGSLVQGKSLQTGVLAPIGLPRAAGTITLATSLDVSQTSIVMERPSLAAAQQATRDLLAPVSGATPARLAFTSIQTESWQQGLLAVGVKADWLSGSAQAEFSSHSTSAGSLMAVKLTQAYYTLAFNPPEHPAGVFDPSVSVEAAGLYMGIDNPPVLISSVTYGRMLILIFRSSATAQELAAAVNAALHSADQSGEIKIDAKLASTLRSSQITVLALGGSGESVVKLIAGDPVLGLQAYLREGATFSKSSPGVPISYLARYLRDNTTAGMALTTSWTQRYLTGVDAIKEVKVGPRDGIVNTGIRIRAGDTIHISGTGTIWSGVIGSGGDVDPRGWHTWERPSEGGYPMQDVSPNCLVGRVDGVWFKVGPKYDETYQRLSDDLRLSVNTNNYTVGSGQWTISIRIERRKETR